MTSNAGGVPASEPSEPPNSTDPDKDVMAELKANYYMVCTVCEQTKAMQQNFFQFSSLNPSKQSDLALLNMCISILEIRQLQGRNLDYTNYQPPASSIRFMSPVSSPVPVPMPVEEQLKKIRENKEKLQQALLDLKNNPGVDEELRDRLLDEMTADYYMLRAQQDQYGRQLEKSDIQLNFLEKLREEKRRIISILRQMRDGLTEDDEVDKTLVAEMLAKYDMLSFQEEEFGRLAQNAEASGMYASAEAPLATDNVADKCDDLRSESMG